MSLGRMPAPAPRARRPIRWIFFDVGNVLLDEDPLTYFTFRRHVEAVGRMRAGISFIELLAEREECATRGSRWPVYEVMSRYLSDSALSEIWRAIDQEARARYADLCPAIPGVTGLLDRLRGRYQLGIIANQPAEFSGCMEKLGWLSRFNVVAINGIEGVSKPDVALFQCALDRAGADPAECLMIGDRLDNDIAPAASLGLSTALVRWRRRVDKGGPIPEPDYDLYLRSLERICAKVETQWRGVRPSLIVSGISGLEVELRS
jgi:5'-nucleotidase